MQSKPNTSSETTWFSHSTFSAGKSDCDDNLEREFIPGQWDEITMLMSPLPRVPTYLFSNRFIKQSILIPIEHFTDIDWMIVSQYQLVWPAVLAH